MAAKKTLAHAPKVQAWKNGLLHEVPGFRTASRHCGLKKNPEKHDLAVLACDSLAAAAGVFTTNKVCAAPVHVTKAALLKSKGRARAVIVNAGNANACTGDQGMKDAQEMSALTAKGLGAKGAELVLVCSTGVIGRSMAMEKVRAGIPQLAQQVKQSSNAGDFAAAIMTTDLVPKTAAAMVEIGGKTIHVAGACKGSGMIAPRMATTLGFVATDAEISPAALQAALSKVADETFNCVTVDGDTSTNDTVLALASGKAGNPPIKSAKGAEFEAFQAALYAVCDSLAKQLAADGEGAEHTITLYVGGTRNDGEARQIARAICESMLVKTAIFGKDPNWGRIVAAAGRSGVDFDPEEASLTVCGIELFREGQPLPFDAKQVSQALSAREVNIVFLAGSGKGRARFYSCDLTYGYVKINADYTT